MSQLEWTDIGRDWVWCAKCGKPIDRLERYRDEAWQRTRWVAHCHGEREQVELTDLDLMEIRSIQPAVAFTQAAVEGATLTQKALAEGYKPYKKRGPDVG